MESKWIGFSKTVWGALLIIATPLAANLGIDFSQSDADTLQGLVLTAFDGINELLGFAIVLWGRITASKGVTVLPGK